MKYKLEWEFRVFSDDRDFFLIGKIEDHATIEGFRIHISKKENENSSRYELNINTKHGVTGCKKGEYNNQESEKIRDGVQSLFRSSSLKMKSWGPHTLVLEKATKETTIEAANILLKHLDLSKEDAEKILSFISEGIFSQKQLFENILTLISQNEIQKAYNMASVAEGKGYKGILFQVAEVFASRHCLQPAYVAFSSVPVTDSQYKQAQIAAAKLAATDSIPFKERQERIKAVFTHCKNAGPEGQSFIDSFFRSMTGLGKSKAYFIKNVQTNFETLLSFADIIARQNEKIRALEEKLEKHEKKCNSNFSFFSPAETSETHHKDEENKVLELPPALIFDH